MKEATLVQTIKKNIKRDYPVAFCVKIADRHTRGIPDLVVIYEGQTLWIETKVDGNSLSPIQEAVHRQIRKAGGRVLVAYDWSDVRDELLDIDNTFCVRAHRKEPPP